MPAFDSIAKLALQVKVSLNWLATGQGEMLAGQEGRSTEIDAEREYAYIPLYDAEVRAGYGTWSEGARILTRLAFTLHSLRGKGLKPENLSAVRIAGDSNEPELMDGDTVLVDHSRTTAGLDGFYVILLDDHLYAKRLQRQFDGSVAVISANPAYQTMNIPKAQVADLVVGRVVWQGRWLI